MDGLECNEIKFSETLLNKDLRIDSAFYTTEIYRNPAIKYEPIGNHLINTQYGISIEMNENSEGYPIYRMNEIHNMLCDLDTNKFANLSHEDFEKFKLKDGDVLFNRTNSYEWVGRTGVYYETGMDQTYASYLVRLVPDKKVILPEYLVAFLSSRYGIKDIKRRARQSINQTNVNPEEVKEILIPLLGLELQLKVKESFIKADQDRKNAKEMYAQAELLLLSTLEITNVTSSDKAVSVKNVSDSFAKTGRLDAEYYQPKYDDFFDILKKYNTKYLGGDNGIVAIKKSIEPGSDAYCNEGIPFIRVSNITKFGISDSEIKLPLDIAPEISALYPKKDTILLSKDGSVGIAYKVEKDLEIITSGALLHLTIKNMTEVLPDYLTLVLNSLIVKLQSERDASGAIIQHWKPSEIEKVIIPILDISIQEQISEKVQQSFALRRQSEQMLEYAKKAVEIAIEQGEKKAIEWLDEKGVES